jgi:hypothetical protein
MRGFLHIFRLGFSARKILIDEHADYGGIWNQLAQ